MWQNPPSSSSSHRLKLIFHWGCSKRISVESERFEVGGVPPSESFIIFIIYLLYKINNKCPPPLVIVASFEVNFPCCHWGWEVVWRREREVWDWRSASIRKFTHSISPLSGVTRNNTILFFYLPLKSKHQIKNIKSFYIYLSTQIKTKVRKQIFEPLTGPKV